MPIQRNKNPMCDGLQCKSADGEVRVYPLGGGGNLILCRACWAHENWFRYERGKASGKPAAYPQVEWEKSEVYEGAK